MESLSSGNTLSSATVYRMPELLVQKFLRCGLTLADLKNKFGINAKRHKKYPNLVTLKYDQIDSPMGEKIVQECRGLILNEDNDWAVVAHGFNKFFNAEEGHAARIDWKTAQVLEKLDGSLCLLYYYNDNWEVATSGTPDAGGEVGDSGHIFRDLFWNVWNDLKYEYPIHKSHTYMFELMTPYNRIVVRHDKSKIVLIGERSIITDQEVDISAQTYPWEVVRQFKLTSLKEIKDSFTTFDPMSQEGYVVVDAYFNRIKLKHPGYVALHHMISTLSVKAVLEIVRQGEMGEILSYYPEWTETFREIQYRYSNLIKEIEAAWEDIKEIEDRKQFALKATKTKLPAALFSLKDNKVENIEHYLRFMNIDTLKGLLQLNDYKITLDYIQPER